MVEDAIRGIGASPDDIENAQVQMREEGCVFAQSGDLMASYTISSISPSKGII